MFPACSTGRYAAFRIHHELNYVGHEVLRLPAEPFFGFSRVAPIGPNFRRAL